MIFGIDLIGLEPLCDSGYSFYYNDIFLNGFLLGD